MNNLTKILEKMKYLQECKKVLPFETLGRSLAYNCYTPRLNFADLQILRKYKIVTLNLSDIENLLQNSINIESKVLDFLESSKEDSKNENKIIIFLQDTFLENIKENPPQFIESKIESTIESSSNKSPLNIIDSISVLRRLTPYFITFDSIIIDCYQIMEIAIAGADMFIFDYRIFVTFCSVLLYLDSKNMSLDSINLMANLTQDSIQKIKNFYENNELEILNLANNLASEILNLANNLALIPIFKIHSANDIESISKIYNIECIICDKKLGNLESYINFAMDKKL